MLNNKQLEPVAVPVNIQQQQVASVRNRRLALQMENRTSVQAALQPKVRELTIHFSTSLG
jgi:hypothetical protein